MPLSWRIIVINFIYDFLDFHVILWSSQLLVIICLLSAISLEPETAGFEPLLQLLTENKSYEAAILPSEPLLLISQMKGCYKDVGNDPKNWTIWLSDKFQPFEYRTSPLSDPHCILQSSILIAFSASSLGQLFKYIFHIFFIFFYLCFCFYYLSFVLSFLSSFLSPFGRYFSVQLLSKNL